MASKHKQIPCDKHGRPITPSDVSPIVALRRAIIFLALGVVLLPLGLVLYNVIELGEGMGMVLFLFAVIIFFGALFLLFGTVILIIALVQKRKLPSRDEQIRLAQESGEKCNAKVVGVRTRTAKVGEEKVTQYKLSLEYYDELYKYKRKFTSDYIDREYKCGDEVTVYYHPDSNIGYYVATE